VHSPSQAAYCAAVHAPMLEPIGFIQLCLSHVSFPSRTAEIASPVPALVTQAMSGDVSHDGARGLTIEEVFNSLSQWKASGGVSSLPRVHLTPRSAKACLQEGVDPEVSAGCCD
jgi:hypothetical protein